jgi:hypothetical protein
MRNLAVRLTRLEKSNSVGQAEPRNDHLSMLLGQLIVLHNPEYRLVTETDTDRMTLAGIRAQVAWADGDILRAVTLEARQWEHRRTAWESLTINEKLARVLDVESGEANAERRALANARMRSEANPAPVTPIVKTTFGR